MTSVRGPSSQQQQQILSFDNFQVSHSIHQKINDELFYKISVENLVGHPIFSFTKNTIKGSSHSKSEEITSWGWSLELSSLLICLPIVCVGFFPLYLFQRFDVGLKCVIIVYKYGTPCLGFGFDNQN